MKNILIPQGNAALLVAGVLLCAISAQAAETPPTPLPIAEIFAPDPTALEGASSGAFTVTRVGPTNSALTINYTISGTASNGVHYAKISGSGTIAAGFSAADIVINPTLNPANSSKQTVTLTLVTNANYQLGKHKIATVNIVADVFGNQPPSVGLVSPADETGFAYPATIKLEAKAIDNDDAVQKVSFYADDDFLGESTQSPYSLVWTNARPGRYALFARAVDVGGKSAISSAVHISVTNPTPAVTLLSPSNGAVFGRPANVQIQAEAKAQQGTIAKVQLYGDNRLLATLTNTPYSLTWSNVSVGKHTVMARATDSLKLTASATASFVVSNSLPDVHLLSPANSASFSAPATITVTASATDSDGSVSRVSFYANGRLLGRVTKSPYEFVWSNVSAGTYKLTAVAADDRDSKTAPEAPVITVK